MNSAALSFDPQLLSLQAAGMTLADLKPLIDGQPAGIQPPVVHTTAGGFLIAWALESDSPSTLHLSITDLADQAGLQLELTMESIRSDVPVQSLGLRIGKAEGVLRYLRNGYTSWDGSFFVGRATEADARANAATGFAMTALVGEPEGTAVIGFLRHDRFQNRLRFAWSGKSLSLTLETLIDGVAHGGRVAAEPIVILAGDAVEDTLRVWARQVAAASPSTPRLRKERITGWCSWYSLYSSISEPVLLEHLQAAKRFRDEYKCPFEVFQIDDGFTPEMGDWLDVKSAFPRGMAPLLADIGAAGFTPGLWIAPFMVGNRSRLFAEHPDWVVTDRSTGKPLAPMKFYGEFRWHKRSEEYYILDITHPAAEAYIRQVFRTWTREWGCQYFKTDFMYFGSEYGPQEALWHGPGLSRIEIWMRMARLIREEIGDSLWLGCGGPIWAPIGLMDAVRIGRDVGVSWRGNHSAESLLRDQTSRNFANNVLWQADPDCILLRDRFHELTDTEVRSLALFAGLSGGLVMTSDNLDEVPAERRALLADLIGDGKVRVSSFPSVGRGESWPDPVLIQHGCKGNGTPVVNVFNTGDATLERHVAGHRVRVGPHDATLLAAAHQ